MAELNLTQAEADALIAMAKQRIDNAEWDYPDPGGAISAQAMAFSWIDTKEVRPLESRAFAILNDSEHPISESVLDAMRNYDVHPVLWSARDQVRQELAA